MDPLLAIFIYLYTSLHWLVDWDTVITKSVNLAFWINQIFIWRQCIIS